MRKLGKKGGWGGWPCKRRDHQRSEKRSQMLWGVWFHKPPRRAQRSPLCNAKRHQWIMKKNVKLSERKEKKREIEKKTLLAREGGGRLGAKSLWDGGGETLCISEQEHHDGSYLHFNLSSMLLLLRWKIEC